MTYARRVVHLNGDIPGHVYHPTVKVTAHIPHIVAVTVSGLVHEPVAMVTASL